MQAHSQNLIVLKSQDRLL